MFSLSEENYLKAIYHLEQDGEGGVNTNALAEEMQTKASSASDMVRKLSDKELVDYKKYQGVKLSLLGRRTAVEVIRRHRLWEVFLVEKLNFAWDEVHELAEQLEHIQSEKLTRELDRFLNYPRRDPHGDPIPDAEGKFAVSETTLLASLEKETSGLVIGVKDSSSDFLQYLDKNGISLGEEVLVLERENYDQSMLLEINGKQLRISQEVSCNLYVKTKKSWRT